LLMVEGFSSRLSLTWVTRSRIGALMSLADLTDSTAPTWSPCSTRTPVSGSST
jgi:hypothetical protein